MIPRIFRWGGIAVMVFAVLAGIQLLAGLGFAYYLRFGSPSSGVDGSLHHWRPLDTLGVVSMLGFLSLLFVAGFYLRRVGTPSSSNHTPVA